jgi:dipeptidyl aminopeptidase/acylaminoacyl peptidase
LELVDNYLNSQQLTSLVGDNINSYQMKLKITWIFYVFCFLQIHAQEKKPITHEDMWLMKRVGAPALSPDGKRIIFSVTEPSYDEKEQVNDIWIANSDGTAEPRKLTAGKAGENAYTWSPDGKHIAFVAKRDGDEESQIYTMNVAEGGEAQRLTKLSTGASSPKWSPDGKMILFNSNVYPQCYVDSCNKKLIEEKKKIKYKARVYTSFPIRNWDKWIDEKQTHAFVQALHKDSLAKDIFTDVPLSKQEGFKYSTAIWSPDGKDILFVASADENSAAFQEPSHHLFKVSVKGGDAIQLTSGKKDFANPVYSIDGNYLYCLQGENNNNKIYNENKLMRFDWPGMKNELLISKQLDRPIQNIIATTDKLYVVAENQGRDLVYSLSLDGSELRLVNLGQEGCYTNLTTSKNGSLILVSSFESVMMPPEIVRINPDGSHTFLTSFNEDKLSKLELQKGETVWFFSGKGKKIRSLLIRPPGFDPQKKYPLFVVMHGGPAGSWKENWSYRWNYQLLAKPGYVLLLTDYTGSTGYGEKFSQDIQYDPFAGPATEINEAAADVIKRFKFIDGSKQAAGGASYGGHLANWMQATTTHYKCLISHAGLVNSISQWGTSDVIFGRELMNGGTPWLQNKTWKEQNPFNYASNFKTPMLVTVGELDYRVPVNNSIENWNILQRQKVPSKLIVFPEENHWILNAENSRFFYQEVHAWLERYLK